MAGDGAVTVRQHGNAGPVVIVVHGGPAAPGSAAPLARGLAGRFRVLEPWQRGSGAEPLTVARHVADLHEVVTGCGAARPALAGHSWGAMLVLAYAVAHPESAGRLALIGCGTFDKAARARLHATLDERTTPELRRRLERLPQECPDFPTLMAKRYEITSCLYQYDPLRPPQAPPPPSRSTCARIPRPGRTCCGSRKAASTPRRLAPSGRRSSCCTAPTTRTPAG